MGCAGTKFAMSVSVNLCSSLKMCDLTLAASVMIAVGFISIHTSERVSATLSGGTARIMMSASGHSVAKSPYSETMPSACACSMADNLLSLARIFLSGCAFFRPRAIEPPIMPRPMIKTGLSTELFIF